MTRGFSGRLPATSHRIWEPGSSLLDHRQRISVPHFKSTLLLRQMYIWLQSCHRSMHQAIQASRTVTSRRLLWQTLHLLLKSKNFRRYQARLYSPTASLAQAYCSEIIRGPVKESAFPYHGLETVDGPFLGQLQCVVIFL